MKLSTMREINPKETTRAYAFELWMKARCQWLRFSRFWMSVVLLKSAKSQV